MLLNFLKVCAQNTGKTQQLFLRPLEPRLAVKKNNQSSERSKMLCYQIYKSTSAKKKKKPILVNTGTNTLNMANVATNTMTTKELLAPLASMEDLSVCMTPMSTPGASPRTRARWSQRSNSRHDFTNFPNTNLQSFSTK